MKCPACTSSENRVMTSRQGNAKISRLRCCGACGHRWTTIELDAANVERMESAVQAVRAFANLSRDFNDGATALG